MKLYFIVACVSIVLSFAQLVERLFIGFNQEIMSIRNAMIEFRDNANKRPVTDEIKQAVVKYCEIDEAHPKILEKARKITSRCVFGGYIISLIILLVLPLINIPDCLLVQKFTALLTLLAFVLFFISLAIDEYFTAQQSEFITVYNYIKKIEELRSEIIQLKEEN